MLLTDLTLETSRLAQLRSFYAHALGLPVVAESHGGIRIQAGTSAIHFKQARDGSSPFYHLAFNIPENKLSGAIGWMAGRADLLPVEASRGPIADFSSWNAHAIYFLDPAGNILELIARHSLPNAAPGPFTAADILCVSEIALVVPDVPAASARIRRDLGAPAYGDPSDEFAAVGDEHGLFIVVKTGRAWFPTRVRPAEVFDTGVLLRDHSLYGEVMLRAGVLMMYSSARQAPGH